MPENIQKITDFIPYCRITKNLSDKTIKAYQQDLKSFQRFIEATPSSNVIQYVSFLIETGHKSTTIKRHLATLAQYFKFIYKDNRLSNPMLELDFKLKSEKNITTYYHASWSKKNV